MSMDPHTGNSASAAGPKKDKKSKKNYEDGDGKKKFVSVTFCPFTPLFVCGIHVYQTGQMVIFAFTV